MNRDDLEKNGEELESQKIQLIGIEQEMKKAFLAYSMSVIVSRALPDVRDGLKPVHRRILYTMYQHNLLPDRAYHKCADTVGNVLGSYHPHGDASVYDALVRLAQDFSMRYPLVDGQGNFGSVDGDPPAAYRYTEARMSKISVEMLTDIEKETVDFMNNYDDRLQEPVYLPSRYPNLLVNGSTGIAVGMATNIPPHNLTEVVDGMCYMIDNPDCTLEELMDHIKGPDFPTGGIIMGKAGIRAAYGTGRGKIYVRARAEIEEEKNGKSRIIVTELPYQVNKAKLVETIDQMAKEKRIEGISYVTDHSDRHGMSVVIDVKRDASPQIVLNQLYNYTQMQVTFGVIMLAIVNGEPKILTLKEMLKHYIEFQEDVICRRTRYDLRKGRERLHILEGLLVAIDFIDEVIAILRASKSIPEGKAALMARFGLDELQASAIVAMRLGQLTGLEREKLEAEADQLRAKIAEYLKILESEPYRLEIVKKEAVAIRDRFGDERRTEIAAVSGEVDIEDLIPVEDCVLTLTSFGYAKRQPVDTFTAQRRGGRGITGMSHREEDVATEMFTCSTHDYVMFFSNTGKVYRLKCYEVPEGSRTSKGTNLANLLPITGEEKITSMIRVPDYEDGIYLNMITRRGIIKRTRLDAYDTARKTGLIAIELDEGDELRWVCVTEGQQDLVVATRNGAVIRFNENDARPMGRTARGVRAIALAEGDEVAGCTVARTGKMILTVGEQGYGRLSDIEDYRIQNRGGKGLKNYDTARYGKVAAVLSVSSDEDDVILISSDGIIIRVAASEIRVCRRPAKGVKVMRVGNDARVITVTSTPHDAKEVTAKVEDDGSADEGTDEE
ncbi:MAG: DNA gyrase subunit A [Clostridia bacterium]|nr:DNA gyrase subunit A [Clostridia bacterium]